ncbi:MAG: hypothetical protein WDZ85_00590 [Candidatus Paceibacterota bacterium]
MFETISGIFSLPFLAVTMGAIDGFNVCSLGALILILSLVLAFRSRRLTLLAGGTFIVMTVLAYGLLIFVWHRVFVYLLPYQAFFSLLLGAAALAGGLYFLLVFINSLRFGPTCNSQGGHLMNRAFLFVESSFNRGGIWAIFLGAAVFALVVTIVEFPCSAALPLAFVGLLADAGVTGAAFLPYLALYLIVYMLDEMIVFAIALYSKKLWYGSPKFIIISSLIGSILLLLIAVHYLFGLPLLFFV